MEEQNSSSEIKQPATELQPPSRVELQNLYDAVREAQDEEQLDAKTISNITAQLDALYARALGNATLQAEIQAQREALVPVEHVQETINAAQQNTENSAAQEVMPPAAVTPTETLLTPKTPSELLLQAQTTKAVIAEQYAGTVTQERQENNRLPADRVSQKLLKPTLGRLLQRASTKIKQSGR